MPRVRWWALLVAVACGHASGAGGALGDPPGFAAVTLSGERVELGGAGPVRLVELWATWCEPCVAAAERARRVLARHPAVTAYSLALDTDPAAVRRHVERHPASGTPLMFPGGAGAASRRGFDAVPLFVVLDPRGRTAGRVVGNSPGLGAALERLLRQAEGRAREPE